MSDELINKVKFQRRDCEHGRQVGKCETCDLFEAYDEIEQLRTQLAKANERLEMLLPITDTLYGLARNQLWIAYVWNDHNFKEQPEKYAKEAAESLSILNVEDANKLFDAYQQLRKEQEK